MSATDIAVDALADSEPRLAGVRPEPFARLTSHQWYYHEARQSVFFAAYSRDAPDSDDLVDLAVELFRNTPQLAALYADLNGGQPTRSVLARLVVRKQVDTLDGYPDAWDMSGDDLFDRHDLPMMRIRAVIRRGGPDEEGRRSMIVVVSTHALFEGVDSALLSRSQAADHEGLACPQEKRSRLLQIGHRIGALVFCPLQLLTALALAPQTVDTGYRSLVVSRARLRRVATRLGVRQRALMFALVAHAVFAGRMRPFKRRIATIVTQIEARNTIGFEGEFFRHWVMMARFRMHKDFATFARDVDAEIARIEKKDKRATQSLLNALFATHRRLKRRLPFLYPGRFFRHDGFKDLALSITPPHRLKGRLARGLMEPVYAGTFHPALNTCVFVPGKNHITFNFAMRRKHIDRIDTLAALFDGLDGR